MILLVYGFHKLSYDEWYTLDSFDLFLSPNELALKISACLHQQLLRSVILHEANLCSSFMYSSCSLMYLSGVISSCHEMSMLRHAYSSCACSFL